MICMGLYGIGSIITTIIITIITPILTTILNIILTTILQHHTALLVNQNIKSQSPRQISVQDVLLRFTDAIFDFM